MQNKIFLSFVLFIFLGCKKNEINCEEEFHELYGKRISLWFDFERQPDISYNNFSADEYQKLKKQVNDSLKITIDCALEKNKENDILYLYKMKQLYLANNLKEIPLFFKTMDRKEIKADFYFQLSLYNLLTQELLTQEKPVDRYRQLEEDYFSNKLDTEYSDRATKEFLRFLIDDNIEEFKKKMLEKYPTSNSMSMQYEENRISIIKEMMVRADGLVFD